MDKPNASVPWASSQVLVGSHLHIVPELLRCLFWEQWSSTSISLSPVVETETGSLVLGLCVRHAIPT